MLRQRNGLIGIIGVMALIIIALIFLLFFFPSGSEESEGDSSEPIVPTPFVGTDEQIGTSETSEEQEGGEQNETPEETGLFRIVGTISHEAAGLTSMIGPTAIDISGFYAYVVSAEGNSLVVIDISTPHEPRAVSAISAEFDDHISAMIEPSDVFVSGGYAYVTAREGDSLSVIDVSIPESIDGTGQIVRDDDFYVESLDGPSSVYVDGNISYVTSYEGSSLSLIDISNPWKPEGILDFTKDSGPNLSSMANPRDVVVSDGYAYVVGGLAIQSSLSILRVEDLKLAKGISSIVNNVYGNRALLDKMVNPRALVLIDEYVYVASEAGNSLAVLNVSDVFDPSPYSQISMVTDPDLTSMVGPVSLAVSGHYVYVVGQESNSLTVLNVTNPQVPDGIGSITSESEGFEGFIAPTAIIARNGYLYVLSKETNTLFILEHVTN